MLLPANKYAAVLVAPIVGLPGRKPVFASDHHPLLARFYILA
jgi:hypothetical protein